MLFLNHFDPSDIAPDMLVDREDEVSRVRSSFESYFDAIEARELNDVARRIVCVTGDKGIGKSIVAAKVVQDLRRKYPGSTLFVSVDCRGTHGARDVIARIASGLVNEIATFAPVVAAGGKPFPPWLEALARVLSNVAHADAASRKTLHQQLRVDKATLKLGGQRMLRALKTEFDLSIEREICEVDGLETTVNFDVDRLFTLATRFFEDLRAAGLRVFLLVDNVDELQHEHWDEDARKNTEATVKRVLRLCDAPIALLLCMRTYFQSIVPRVADEPLELEALPTARLLEIVDHRIGFESASVQQGLRADAARAVIETLAARATTPLAMITWVKWVAESTGGFATPLDAHACKWRDPRHVDFASIIAATLKLFAVRRAEGVDAVATKDLVAAIGNDEDGFRYLQTTELILPRDFWNPTQFVLDPSAAWIAGSACGHDGTVSPTSSPV